ncbi:MAG: hypothetical protein ACKVOT_10525 [Polaromonas sp.]
MKTIDFEALGPVGGLQGALWLFLTLRVNAQVKFSALKNPLEAGFE